MRKIFVFYPFARAIMLALISIIIHSTVVAQCDPGTLKGAVFVDANFNGVRDAGESGQSGILVRIYNASGASVSQAITDGDGNFLATGLENGKGYLVDFTLQGSALVSAAGPDNGTDVQLVQVPDCSVNMGILNSDTNCSATSELILSCFANDLGGNNPDQETLIGLVQNFNTTTAVRVYATKKETGSVWGMAYNPNRNEIYSSAFVKQNASLTTHGHDAIFVTKLTTPPSTQLLAKLSELGQQVGGLSVSDPKNCSYGRQVGKVGLGGMTMDSDYEYIYVANLYNNTIVKINAENPQPETTTTFFVPNPGCSFNDFRVFALKYYNGRLYVGVTCTAETSQDDTETSVHVFSMNTTSGNFTPELSTDFSRGPWTDVNNDKAVVSQWLTDIDFSDEGNMLLALSDRKGHNYCKGIASRVDNQFGDLIMAENVNGTWVLESNGKTNSFTGTGVANGQGPGGGEFFGDDFFPLDKNVHPEVCLGSIAVTPTTGQVVAAVYDPLFNSYSGGLHRYRTDTGKKTGSRELYNSNVNKYFGKATGFGDIISVCGPISAEIGNLVWIDENCDGLQNGGEPGVPGIRMLLFDDNCNFIGITSTDEKGRYSFNASNVDRDGDGNMDGLVPGNAYFLSLDSDYFDPIIQNYNINGTFYYPTTIVAGNKINSDLVSSAEACINNQMNSMPVVEITPARGNNPSYDIGLKASTDFDLALSKKIISDPNIKIGGEVEFEIKIVNQGTVATSSFEIVDYITEAYTFSPSKNPGWVVIDGTLRKTVNKVLNPSIYHIEKLRLDYVGSNDPTDDINYAEISAAFDISGAEGRDIDSQADVIKNNDKGGVPDSDTDDLLTDDGTFDEDDHDPAYLRVLDLALKNVIRDARAYDVGDDAVFDMTVYNQGNLPVAGFQVNNMFPPSLSFSVSKNPGWTTGLPGFVKYNSNEFLYPGESRTISLVLTVMDNNGFDDIIDMAEISAMTPAFPEVTTDIDSDPDDFMFNDKGGNPYDFTDNLITDRGVEDEDDHDPAILNVRKFDLALTKTTEHVVHNIGDHITFEITVYNQGDVTAGTVTLVDYIPDNMSLMDNSWTYTDAQTVVKTIQFAQGLAPGEEHTETIRLRLDESAPRGEYIINYAEIASVSDVYGVDLSSKDVDSQADMDRANDNGGQLGTLSDNNIFDTGAFDEDDHDPAGLFVAKLNKPTACQCLDNATQPFNGQFVEELNITSVSGETWYIDEYNQIFDPSSTPGSLVPFTTGPGGYQLSEVDLGNNTSLYLFTGIFRDGERYNIRFTNGSGAFLQAEGGGDACSYNRPVVTSISGLSAVCAGSSHSYTIQNLDGCTDFTWSLSGGGSIVGSKKKSTITVQWDNSTGGPFELRLDSYCSNDCMAPIVEEIRVGNGGAVMSCLSTVNVSLNFDCNAHVDPGVFLTSAIPPGTEYQLMLLNDHGQLVPNNYLTEEYLWETLTAKVIDPCTGNSCWSTLTVEDKMAPSIDCGDIALPCYLLNNYEPLVLDNCTDATYSLVAETVQPLQCDPDYIKEITRTYVTTDSYGNQSAPCAQTISLERIDFADIVPPSDYLLTNGTNLTCIDSIYNDAGEPDTDITGTPVLDGFSLFPIQDLYCNIAVEYEDFIAADFGCIRKIMRTWRVYEDWCTIGNIWTYVQTIEIADTEEPVIVCPPDLTVTSDGGGACESTIAVDLPTIIDDCSSSFVIDLSYVGGFIENVEEPQSLTYPSGTTKLVYNIYDACENLSSCDVNITVLDETPPVAVCDENTVVSLRSNGTAKAFADTFDDGSYDDCSLFNSLVRRPDSPCDCGRPVFDDMHFLGERNGRYYYLSKFLTHGSKAFLYSSAYGGMLLTLESEEEADWVYDQTRGFITSSYYIGLSDADHQGTFTWSNHAEPDFDKWDSGQPDNSGDHVITNSDGEWVVVDGNDVETYYVLELSDPCGYSDQVTFCCEDVTEEQMVIFRVIDYFGKVNECMVMVEVQDKVAPNITCPPDQELSCEQPINLENLSEFGSATASDQCSVSIREELIDERDDCGFGDLIRRFYAEDNNGFSSCDQILTVSQTNKFDNNSIIWPEDFDTDLGCNSGDLHPDSLDFEFSRPQYQINSCSNVIEMFEDKTYDFSGNNGTDACLKILRTWTVIDWCQQDDPGYAPAVYQQTIKVTNLVGPEILGGCDSLEVRTFECEMETVNFSVSATDDCTPDSELEARIQLDIFSDGGGDFDIDYEINGATISFNQQLPVGEHFALISFTDQCNNTTTCSKIIEVVSLQGPTAACVEGLNVALEPMDLDNDGEFDTEMACITPQMIDASSTHICGFDFTLSFSADITDTLLCFDCDNLDILNEVELWITDEFGNTDFCTVFVDVQDNNDQDFCPRFDLALTKTLDSIATPGPFMQGSDVTFNLTVYNQGNMNAFNIELVDYIPEGLVLNDPDWTDMGNGMATLTQPIEFLEDSTSVVVPISFNVDPDFMGFSLTNVAEVKAADDDNDPENGLAMDDDSSLDMINDDNIGGDNTIDDENNDEDDHDFETIEVEQIFDLSIDKDCAAGETGPFVPGENVTFTISVTNEGTLDAYDVMVVDYIPDGLTLNDTDWQQSGNTATLDEPIPFVPRNATVTVDITFTIDADYMELSIVNAAEIIDPNGDFPIDDIDSTPGDGNPNQDDWDDKQIEITQTFDLALTKVLDEANTPNPIEVGDDVVFIVTVYNQGSLDASDVDVMDYVPAGFTFNPAKNSDFVVAGNNAQATIPFVASCQSVDLSITLTLDDQLPAPTLVNNAEIIDANNALGFIDQDDPLSNTNDGSVNELATDGDINDESDCTPGVADNPNDEDDYDPTEVEVNCPPTAICNPNLIVMLDASGIAAINADLLDNGSSDDCNQQLVFTISQELFTCDDLGDNPVDLTVTANPSGLTDDCTATVTVIDVTTPMAVCQDITVAVGNDGMVTIDPEDIDDGSSDQCNLIDLELDITDFDCDDVGELNPVVLTVTDTNGNADTCEANVTVIDQINPIVTCANGAIIVDLGPDGTETLSDDTFYTTITENCSIQDISVSQSTFDCDDVDLGNIIIQVLVTDIGGNTAICETTVNVVDTDDPECTVGFTGVDIPANTPITTSDFDIFTVTDNCTGSGDVDIAINPGMFDCDDVGNQEVVVVTVTDGSGNSSTCSVTVDVIDDTTPVCVAQDITVSLDGSGMYSLAAAEVDNGSTAGCTTPTLSVTPNQFDCGDTGNNLVTLTVSANGQSSNCNATVTVVDDEAPMITCEPDFTLSLTGSMVMISTMDIIASSSDNCSISMSTIDISAFDCDDDGETITVTATVIDPSGNMASCTTDVTIDDDAAPSCTLLQDLTFAPNMNITLANIVSNVNTFFTDNCATAPATVTGVPVSFDCTMLGSNTITVTVSDGSGNTATCTTDVTIEDIPAPVCIPMDITVSLDNEGNYDLEASEVDGGSFAGCALPITLSVTPMFLGCNDVDLSPVDVVLTVTDNNGNSTSCVAEVTVVDDIDPVITCVSTLTVDLDANGEVNLVPSDIIITADDGCGIGSQVLDINAFDCSDKNTTTTVTATVSDTNGNTSTCEADVTIEDNTAPTCTIAAGLTFPPEVTITPAQVLGSFSDNCATASAMSTLVPNEFTCNDIGNQMVTLTVEDDCGNSSTCSGTIEIIDNSVPVAVCVDITVNLDADGEYVLTAAEVDGGSSASCGENLTLSVTPTMFDCGDLGDNTVTLTVTASGGGTDTCEATVSIVDNTPPVVVCPAPMTLPCETDISDLTVFGTPSASDNCDNNLSITETDSINVNTCNVGVIIRTFTTTDDSGNTATCTQTITIQGPANPLVEADITWPMSPFDPGNCIPDPNNIDSGMPIVDTSGLDCFNVTVTSSDNVIGDPQCNGTIERTWVVTDSCQAPGGVFTFTQIINILDDEGPDITGPSDMTIILPPGNTTCDTFLNLAATVSDCVGGFTASNDSPFATNNNIADASGTYPVGETLVTVTATDICGNTSTIDYVINVVDTTAFFLDCAKVIDNIESNQQVVVHIDQTQYEVDFGDCMGGSYTVSWSNTVPNQDTVIATCSHVGIQDYTIYLWSGGLVIDSCTNLFQIVDGGGFCTTAIIDGTVTGTLSMEDKRLIDGVNIALDGSPFETIKTGNDGRYAFPKMPFGGDYQVVPEKDYDYLNGVSTLDLIAIQKHILGTQRIDSPYRLIAADIDRSGNITGTDLLELRKLILGVYETLPQNTSWRMIDKSYKFLDPQDPFAFDIPEIYEIFKFNQSMIIDFIGVKVGDVNNTAVANANDSRIDRRSSQNFLYTLEEMKYKAGKTVEVVFSSEELSQIEGIQHSLIVDPRYAELIEIVPASASVSRDNFYILDKENGLVNFSWHGAIDPEEEASLFTVKLRITRDAWTSDLFRIDETNMRAEAYYSLDRSAGVDIEYRAGDAHDEAISLYQNVPNPWTESTVIKFYMPEKQAYSINIYDINGKLIYKVSDVSRIGVNELEIRNDLIDNGGVLYYELVSADVRLINKMLLLR